MQLFFSNPFYEKDKAFRRSLVSHKHLKSGNAMLPASQTYFPFLNSIVWITHRNTTIRDGATSPEITEDFTCLSHVEVV